MRLAFATFSLRNVSSKSDIRLLVDRRSGLVRVLVIESYDVHDTMVYMTYMTS